MNKEILIKLATGLFAKLLRYAIAAGGGAAAVDDSSVIQTSAGIAAIVVSLGWSIWEDRMKAKAKTTATNPPKP